MKDVTVYWTESVEYNRTVSVANDFDITDEVAVEELCQTSQADDSILATFHVDEVEEDNEEDE